MAIDHGRDQRLLRRKVIEQASFADAGLMCDRLQR
jgi:hypothetical protein